MDLVRAPAKGYQGYPSARVGTDKGLRPIGTHDRSAETGRIRQTESSGDGSLASGVGINDSGIRAKPLLCRACHVHDW